jgi:ABC-2 type transport system permease protein
MNRRRLWTLMVREARATLRDPFTLAILVAVPVGAMLIFGFMLSTEVQGLALAVHDADQTPASRRLVRDLGAGGVFAVRPAATTDALEAGLVRGTFGAGLVIPPGFGRALAAGEVPAVQALYDGAEAVLAGNAEAFLQSLVAASGAALAARAVAPAGVAVGVRPLFNPRLDGTPFMVAGVFGFVLSFLTTLITAVMIVNERLAGTFEQLQVTPATSVEILLGKLLPLGAVFACDVVFMMLVGGFVMGVWPQGNVLLFVGVSAFYVLQSLALGLIFSATSATPAEAVQKTVLFSIPLVQLSGFAFPVRNMPEALQWVTQLFPATHYIAISRAIYLRAEGGLALLPELLWLLGFGVVLILWARRTLEARA